MQLSVWRPSGIRSLLNSRAATPHGTSGGGGVEALELARPWRDMADALRRSLGTTVLAEEAWVGDEYVGGEVFRGFDGSPGTTTGALVCSSCSSSVADHHDGSYR